LGVENVCFTELWPANYSLLPVASTAQLPLRLLVLFLDKKNQKSSRWKGFFVAQGSPSKAGYTGPRRTGSRHFLAQSSSISGGVTKLSVTQINYWPLRLCFECLHDSRT